MFATLCVPPKHPRKETYTCTYGQANRADPNNRGDMDNPNPFDQAQNCYDQRCKGCAESQADNRA